jgi:DNA repair exonuclease SbcCD nuclease subunit
MTGRPLRLVHTSDLHLGATYGSWHGRDGDHGLPLLQRVLAAAQAEDAAVLLLVGDIFDSNRVGDDLVTAVARLLTAQPLPVVFLPGNHDCYTPDSVYRRLEAACAGASNVHMVRSPEGETLRLPEADLALWGRAHVDYADCRPLAGLPPRGRERWQVALAHGHYVRGPQDLGRSYLIYPQEIAACGRDYVALGHWDLPADVSVGGVVAAYSGSPARTGQVLLVELGEGVRYRPRPI